MPFYILAQVIQLLLIIHVIRTGRDRYWIWILIIAPAGLGALAYMIIEIIPEFGQSVSGQKAARKVKGALDPAAEVRLTQQAFARSENAETARHYADALIQAGRRDEALNILQRMMRGVYADDALLLELQARAQFDLERFGAAISSLGLLKQRHPQHRSAESHLLFARALEAHGRIDRALQEYSALADYYPGAEARLRWSEALLNNGDENAARQQLDAILHDAGLAPAYFRKAQKHWLQQARQLRAGLN